MAVYPETARLTGGQSQRFTCEDDGVEWRLDPQIGTVLIADSRTCVYTAPPKHRVWFSDTVVLTATFKSNDAGRHPGSALITVSSAPAWMAAITIFYVVLFFGLLTAAFGAWPPAPAVPWIELSPPVVTVAPGLTVQFDSRIWHARDTAVTWSASDGLLTPNGLFTAPASGERAIVSASRSSDRTLGASALVILKPRGLAIQPTTSVLTQTGVLDLKAIESQSGNAAPLPPSKLDWSASDPSVKIVAQDDGTAIVRVAGPIHSFRRVVVTAIDRAEASRQASAVVYLNAADVPIDEEVPQAELVRDKSLIELVLIVGALGALLGASRSFGNFVGNGTFVPRWSLFYVFRPAFGAGLALLVFFGYRIGAVSGFRGAAPADPFTATFVAGMVGLFADTVLQKLKDLITALFPVQDDRRDKITPQAAAPTIDSAEGSLATKQMRIVGRNFASGSTVHLDSEARATEFISASELTASLTGKDKAGVVRVSVVNPDRQASAGFAGNIREAEDH